jgi:hypothetical protein
MWLGRLKLAHAFFLRRKRKHCARSILKRGRKLLDIVRSCCLLLLRLAEAGFPFELIDLVLCLCFFLVCFAISLLVLEQPVSLLVLRSHNNIRRYALDLLFPPVLLQRCLRLHSFHLLLEFLLLHLLLQILLLHLLLQNLLF